MTQSFIQCRVTQATHIRMCYNNWCTNWTKTHWYGILVNTEKIKSVLVCNLKLYRRPFIALAVVECFQFEHLQ